MAFQTLSGKAQQLIPVLAPTPRIKNTDCFPYSTIFSSLSKTCEDLPQVTEVWEGGYGFSQGDTLWSRTFIYCLPAVITTSYGTGLFHIKPMQHFVQDRKNALKVFADLFPPFSNILDVKLFMRTFFYDDGTRELVFPKYCRETLVNLNYLLNLKNHQIQIIHLPEEELFNQITESYNTLLFPDEISFYSEKDPSRGLSMRLD